ncbi:MAG: cytidylyltransferase domain-containing protein [Thalassotalea sp.]
MLKNKKVLAFIGARSGSKGLIDKNIKLLNGKPLMAWTILAALQSQYIDEVVVSTDSKVYAEIAEKYGAKVIIRPQALASDTASLMAALNHSVMHFQQQKSRFDIVVNLQPTSPLRSCEHIDEALELYAKNQTEQGLRVFSCYKVLNKFAWIMRCNEQGFADFIDQQEQQKSQHARQENADVLLPNGAIFILPANDLTSFYNGTTLPYLMPENKSIDIDSQADFDLAEQLFNA